MSSNDDNMRKKITIDELKREGLAALLEKGLSPNALVVEGSKELNPKPLLFFYVDEGDLNNLRLLIDKGADLNIRGSFREHVLHYFAMCVRGDVYVEIFDLLIKQKNIDLNAQNKFGLTPIMHFFSIITMKEYQMDRMLEVIKRLAEAHVDLNKVVKMRGEDATAISLAKTALSALREDKYFYDEENKKNEQKFLDLIQFLIQESKKQALGQQRVPGSAPGSRFAVGDTKSGAESKESEKDKDKDKDEKPKRKPS